MARVKLHINGVKKKLLQSTVVREGERAVDEVKFKLPPCVDICVNDTVQITQDMVNVDNLSGLYNFCSHFLDESGFCNNPNGSADVPRADVVFNFEACSTDNQCGFRNVCVTSNGCFTFTNGQLGVAAACFDGSTNYLTVSNECFFDIDLTTPLSASFWIRTCSSTEGVIMAKKAGLTTDKGWEIKMDMCGKIVYKMTNTECSNEIEVRSDTAFNDGTFHHFGMTYNGVPCASNVSMVKDGVSETFVTVTDNLSLCALNGDDLSIGAYADGVSKITAELDDVRIMSSIKISTCEQQAIRNAAIIDYTNGKDIGDAVRFDGVESELIIPINTSLDFTADFDIFIWSRWQTTALGYIVTRRTLSGNGWALAVNSVSTGDVQFQIDGINLTAAGSFNDNEWHLIRIKRTDGAVILFIDDVSKATGTKAADLTLPATMTFGRNHNRTAFFAGDVSSIRLYKGIPLSDAEATKIFTKINPNINMKFGGFATKVAKNIEDKDIVAQSFGKILGDTEVRGELFNSRTPEFIIEDLIKNNTDLITHVHGLPSGAILTHFTADGKLIDIVRDLVGLIGKAFHTDGVGQFHLHDEAFEITDTTIIHGVNAQVFITKGDDTEIINDLVVIGENKRYQTTDTFAPCTHNCLTDFVLNAGPTSSKVFVMCVEQEPEDDFEVDSLGKTIQFNVAPGNGCEVRVEYEYELPLLIRGVKSSSIAVNGRHAKRLVMPWIRTRNDGIKFINGYLNRFKNVRTNLHICLPTHANTLDSGQVVRVINSVKNLDNTFVIKGVTYTYPDYKTAVDAGEFTFDDLEYEKQMAEKMHDLESAVTTIKEIREFESFEECLGITDVVTRFEAGEEGTIFTECLALCDTVSINEVTVAIYGCSTYNGGDIYGQIAPIGGFTISGFTTEGFVT